MTVDVEVLHGAVVEKTSPACPAQWEGTVADGRFVYVRYRHGWLAIGFGTTMEEAVESAMGERVAFLRQMGDDSDGWLTWEQVLEAVEADGRRRLEERVCETVRERNEVPMRLAHWDSTPITTPQAARARRLEEAALGWERDAARYFGERAAWCYGRASHLWGLAGDAWGEVPR